MSLPAWSSALSAHPMSLSQVVFEAAVLTATEHATEALAKPGPTHAPAAAAATAATAPAPAPGFPTNHGESPPAVAGTKVEQAQAVPAAVLQATQAGGSAGATPALALPASSLPSSSARASVPPPQADSYETNQRSKQEATKGSDAAGASAVALPAVAPASDLVAAPATVLSERPLLSLPLERATASPSVPVPAINATAPLPSVQPTLARSASAGIEALFMVAETAVKLQRQESGTHPSEAATSSMLQSSFSAASTGASIHIDSSADAAALAAASAPIHGNDVKRQHAKWRKNTLAPMPLTVALSFLPSALRAGPPVELTNTSPAELSLMSTNVNDPDAHVLVGVHMQGSRVIGGSESGGAGHLCVQTIRVGNESMEQRVEYMARASFQRRVKRTVRTGKANELRHQEPHSFLWQRSENISTVTIAPNASANPSHYRALHLAIRGQERPLAQRAYGIPDYIWTHTPIYARRSDVAISRPRIDRAQPRCKHQRGGQLTGVPCACVRKKGGFEIKECMNVFDANGACVQGEMEVYVVDMYEDPHSNASGQASHASSGMMLAKLKQAATTLGKPIVGHKRRRRSDANVDEESESGADTSDDGPQIDVAGDDRYMQALSAGAEALRSPQQAKRTATSPSRLNIAPAVMARPAPTHATSSPFVLAKPLHISMATAVPATFASSSSSSSAAASASAPSAGLSAHPRVQVSPLGFMSPARQFPYVFHPSQAITPGVQPFNAMAAQPAQLLPSPTPSAAMGPLYSPPPPASSPFSQTYPWMSVYQATTVTQ